MHLKHTAMVLSISMLAAVSVGLICQPVPGKRSVSFAQGSARTSRPAAFVIIVKHVPEYEKNSGIQVWAITKDGERELLRSRPQGFPRGDTIDIDPTYASAGWSWLETNYMDVDKLVLEVGEPPVAAECTYSPTEKEYVFRFTDLRPASGNSQQIDALRLLVKGWKNKPEDMQVDISAEVGRAEEKIHSREKRLRENAVIEIPVQQGTDEGYVRTINGREIRLSQIHRLIVEARTVDIRCRDRNRASQPFEGYGPVRLKFSTLRPISPSKLGTDVELGERMISPRVFFENVSGKIPPGLPWVLLAVHRGKSDNARWWSAKLAHRIDPCTVKDTVIREKLSRSDYEAIGLRLWDYPGIVAPLDGPCLSLDVGEHFHWDTLYVRDSLYDMPIADFELVFEDYHCADLIEQRGDLIIFPYLGKLDGLRYPPAKGLNVIRPNYESRWVDLQSEIVGECVYLKPRQVRLDVKLCLESPGGPPPSHGRVRFKVAGVAASGADAHAYGAGHRETLNLPYGSRLEELELDASLRPWYIIGAVKGIQGTGSSVEWRYAWVPEGRHITVVLRGKPRELGFRYEIDEPNRQAAEPRFTGSVTLANDSTYEAEIVTRRTESAIVIRNASWTAKAVSLALEDSPYFESMSQEIQIGSRPTLRLRRRRPAVVVLLDASKELIPVWRGVADAIAEATAEIEKTLPNKLLLRVGQGERYEEIPLRGIRDFFRKYWIHYLAIPDPLDYLPRAAQEATRFNQGIPNMRNRIIYVMPNDPLLRVPWREANPPYNPDEIDLFVVEIGFPPEDGREVFAMARDFFGVDNYRFVKTTGELRRALHDFALSP